MLWRALNTSLGWSSSWRQMTSGSCLMISSSILHRRRLQSNVSGKHRTKLSFWVPRAWARTFHWNKRRGSPKRNDDFTSENSLMKG